VHYACIQSERRPRDKISDGSTPPIAHPVIAAPATGSTTAQSHIVGILRDRIHDAHTRAPMRNLESQLTGAT